MNGTQRMGRLVNPRAKWMMVLVLVAAIAFVAGVALTTFGHSRVTRISSTPAMWQVTEVRPLSPRISRAWTPPRPATSSVYDGQSYAEASDTADGAGSGGQAAPRPATGSVYDGQQPRSVSQAAGVRNAPWAPPQLGTASVYDGRTSGGPR